MLETLVETFCLVDDFCQEHQSKNAFKHTQNLLGTEVKRRNRPGRMAASEIITIAIGFHQTNYRHFKAYYCEFVQPVFRPYFPKLISYSRFVTLLKSVYTLLSHFLQRLLLRLLPGQNKGVYFVDSTAIKACHIKREHSHRVFRGIARKSKGTMGWFFGFKMHLVINYN